MRRDASLYRSTGQGDVPGNGLPTLLPIGNGVPVATYGLSGCNLCEAEPLPPCREIGGGHAHLQFVSLQSPAGPGNSEQGKSTPFLFGWNAGAGTVFDISDMACICIVVKASLQMA